MKQDDREQRSRITKRDHARQRFAVTASFAVVLAAVLFGCSKTTEVTKHAVFRVVEDDLGRAVNLPPAVERAVSLAPSITESVFAAGAGDRLVGVTTYCNFPAEAASIRRVGDTQTPNIENIVALKPQVVLVSTDSQLEAFTAILQQQNISVFVLDVRGLDGVPRSLRQLGSIFGSETAADKAATELERRIETVAGLRKANVAPRVFLQISKEPLFTIGRGSFLTEVIERAGGVSVTKDVESSYPKLSKESAAALDPEVIILSESEDNLQPNEVFRNSPAFKNGRIYRINADVISRPGPRLVDALETIAEALGRE